MEHESRSSALQLIIPLSSINTSVGFIKFVSFLCATTVEAGGLLNQCPCYVFCKRPCKRRGISDCITYCENKCGCRNYGKGAVFGINLSSKF